MKGKIEQKKIAMDVRYTIAQMELEDQPKKMKEGTKSKVSCAGFLLDIS